MADWKALNDRDLRKSAREKILGPRRSAKHVENLDQADFVAEAAQFLRQMREHAELSQEALGKKLGVTQPRIAELERGNSPEGMSYALLRRAAKACGFDHWPPAPVDAATADEVEPADILPVQVIPGPQGEWHGYRRALKAKDAVVPFTFDERPRSRFMERVVERYMTRIGLRSAAAKCTVFVVGNGIDSDLDFSTKLIRDALDASPAITVVKRK